MSWWSRFRAKRSFDAVKETEQASGASAAQAEQIATEVATTEQARDEANVGTQPSDTPTDISSWSKAELYEEATKRGIAGRSSMSKVQLIEALSK